MADLLTYAHRLADLADAITLPAFRQGLEVELKDDGTFVTAADRGAEQRLREQLAADHPEHVLLGEEFGGRIDHEGPNWIIDPIDGTNNFVSGNPVWATLIAHRDGEHEVAVISAPALGSRWDAVIEPSRSEARADGRPVRVSQRTLGEGQVSFGGLKYFGGKGHDGLVDRLTRATRRQRGFGDFWQHCLVAQGSIEVAVEAEVSAWDLAAVRTLVVAAGGRFTDLTGTDTIEGGSAISSNGRVHDEVLAMVALG